MAARDAFRRSLRANDDEVEARLRLIRILLQLDELDEAEREVQRLKKQPSGEIFQYLTLLFEGDLYERKGDTAAAMRAYEAAVPLAMFPHAALVARAQLAYKTGELEILALRERAKRELGARFDLRAYHDLVLGGGALPLTLLADEVGAWIASQREPGAAAGAAR